MDTNHLEELNKWAAGLTAEQIKNLSDYPAPRKPRVYPWMNWMGDWRMIMR